MAAAPSSPVSLSRLSVMPLDDYYAASCSGDALCDKKGNTLSGSSPTRHRQNSCFQGVGALAEGETGEAGAAAMGQAHEKQEKQ